MRSFLRAVAWASMISVGATSGFALLAARAISPRLTVPLEPLL